MRGADKIRRITSAPRLMPREGLSYSISHPRRKTYRLATAPINRSHSSKLPENPSCVVTQSCVYLAALSAFCVVSVPMMTARNENV